MTNPYQIAKATGLPLRSIQKLLAQTRNPTLKNIDTILHGLGITLYEEEIPGASVIQQGKRKLTRKAKPAKDG